MHCLRFHCDVVVKVTLTTTLRWMVKSRQGREIYGKAFENFHFSGAGCKCKRRHRHHHSPCVRNRREQGGLCSVVDLFWRRRSIDDVPAQMHACMLGEKSCVSCRCKNFKSNSRCSQIQNSSKKQAFLLFPTPCQDRKVADQLSPKISRSLHVRTCILPRGFRCSLMALIIPRRR